uniref:Uncharacterized protein n=1 Tax=Romanomermis culicivorax TaxID=13658 RepID=A0A915IJP9_ROMCU
MSLLHCNTLTMKCTMSYKRLSLDQGACDRNIIDQSDFDGRLKAFVSKNFLTLYNRDYKLKGLESSKPDNETDRTSKCLIEADCKQSKSRINSGSIAVEECISLGMRRDDFIKDTLIRARVHSLDVTEKTIRLTFQSMPDISLRLTVLSLSPLFLPREIFFGYFPHRTEIIVGEGIINECDLPLFFRNEDYDHDFDKCLKSERTFDNPNSIDLLCQRLGLSIFNHSTPLKGQFLMKNKNHLLNIVLLLPNSVDYSSEKRAGHLRKVQTHTLAMKSVERGVEKLRNNDSLIAMQHFNKALQIEAENVEALVARGALFANKESFDLAVQDFTAALANQPSHRNAKIYLVETLIAQSKAFQREDKWRKAKKCLDSVLELDADNAEALKLIASLKNGPGDCANDCKEVINKSRSEKVSLDPSIIEKYGVDRRTFKNPDFRSKFDEYRQKFNKKHSSYSSNGCEIIDLTHEASSSNTVGESKRTAKRKYNENVEEQNNVNLKREANSNNSIDHIYKNSLSKNNGKDEIKTDRSDNAHKAPRNESNGQWKKDLKKMEDFIHVLKTKKK